MDAIRNSTLADCLSWHQQLISSCHLIMSDSELKSRHQVAPECACFQVSTHAGCSWLSLATSSPTDHLAGWTSDSSFLHRKTSNYVSFLEIESD